MIHRIKKLLAKTKPAIAPEQAYNILEIKLGRFHKINKGWPAITLSDEENRTLISDMAENRINVEALHVSPDSYIDYINTVGYLKKYPRYYPGSFTEKTLEHYIAFSLLKPLLRQNRKFIDIAAERSPHGGIFSRLTGCKGYMQDLSYKKGVHRCKIGSDAGNIPLPDNSFHAALAACSIEHFERDSDISLIKEMCRILVPGGMVVILPLYIHKKAFCATDPVCAAESGVVFDPGIDIHCIPGWNNRHGRYYSHLTLRNRLITPHEDQMDFKVYHIDNLKDFAPSVYCRFALAGVKKAPRGSIKTDLP